jgi:prevent-host-death family protein
MTELNVGVRDLKTHLSEYLREIKKGKTIVITEHGKPVGRLIPTALPQADRIEAMRRAGIIAWNGKKLKVPATRSRVSGRGALAELLVEDRQ